jgi:hypothetical protein
LKFSVKKHKSREEMMLIFDSILETFEKAGAKEFQGTFYVNLYGADSNALSFADKVSHYEIDGLTPINDPVDSDEIYASLSKRVILMPEAQRRRKRKEYMAPIVRLREQERKEEMEVARLKQQEDGLAWALVREEDDAFKTFICSSFGVTDRHDFSKVFSSANRITCKRTILNHLNGDESLFPEEGYVFRATLKKTTEKPSVVMIYNLKHELIREYSK